MATQADSQRCDVYVAAGVQVDLSARLKIIAELWRNGISADLQYDDDRSLEDVTEECEDQSTP
jgi:translation initiation factor 2-alpha kinase 4